MVGVHQFKTETSDVRIEQYHSLLYLLQPLVVNSQCLMRFAPQPLQLERTKCYRHSKSLRTTKGKVEESSRRKNNQQILKTKFSSSLRREIEATTNQKQERLLIYEMLHLATESPILPQNRFNHLPTILFTKFGIAELLTICPKYLSNAQLCGLSIINR